MVDVMQLQRWEKVNVIIDVCLTHPTYTGSMFSKLRSASVVGSQPYRSLAQMQYYAKKNKICSIMKENHCTFSSASYK